MSRTERESSVDCGAVYEQVRGEFAHLAAALAPERLDTVVPAAPDWAVRDVVAHVVGLAAALNAQDFPADDDEGGTVWAGRHVAARRERTIDELLTEWAAEAPSFAEGLRLFGYEFGCHFVADLVVHVHDVQAALELPPLVDPVVLAVALDHYCDHLSGLLAGAGWGRLTVQSHDGEQWYLGAGAPRVAVAGSAYDLLRTLAARRSERQVRVLRWSGDVDGLVAFLRECWTGGYSLPVADQP